MNLWQSFRVALRALAANRLRSALTMLGMIIGVGAVIALMSIGKGAGAQITSSIQSMGTNLLFINAGAPRESGVRQAAGSQPTLTLEDAEAMADPARVPSVAKVAPEMTSFAQIVAGPQNWNSRVVGVTPDYEDVRNFHVAIGDFIQQEHMDSRSLVAVLGNYTAQQLFGEIDPVGQSVKINRISFRVIGVLETKGSQAMGNQDDLVFVPLSAFQQRLNRGRAVRGGHLVGTINVQVAAENLIDQATEEIGNVLRDRHRTAEDDFTIRSQEDMLATANQISGIMTLLLGSIAGISLVVGGIGIMNIMLVSVTERTREIGIRKAVGARRRDILSQFLIEAVVVSLVGGGIGIALGVGLAQILGRVSVQGQKIPSVVSPDAVFLAVGVSVAVGLFFGIYPASRASRLNPIEALRYE